MDKFNYACYLDCNKEEIRKDLERMGYDVSNIKDTKIICTHRDGTCDDKPEVGSFYCSDHVYVFRSLAALNDNNDFLQMFTSEEPICESGIVQRQMFICDEDDYKKSLLKDDPDMDVSKWHKLSAEEIVKTFSKTNVFKIGK